MVFLKNFYWIKRWDEVNELHTRLQGSGSFLQSQGPKGSGKLRNPETWPQCPFV
jgi:hypothetical protein